MHKATFIFSSRQGHPLRPSQHSPDEVFMTADYEMADDAWRLLLNVNLELSRFRRAGLRRDVTTAVLQNLPAVFKDRSATRPGRQPGDAEYVLLGLIGLVNPLMAYFGRHSVTYLDTHGTLHTRHRLDMAHTVMQARPRQLYLAGRPLIPPRLLQQAA